MKPRPALARGPNAGRLETVLRVCAYLIGGLPGGRAMCADALIVQQVRTHRSVLVPNGLTLYRVTYVGREREPQNAGAVPVGWPVGRRVAEKNLDVYETHWFFNW